MEKLNKGDFSKGERWLNWAYEQVLSSHGPINSAIELAESYQGRYASVAKDAKALVRSQMLKTGSVGFAAGFGGLPTAPVTIPMELTAVLFCQIRMVAAIAHLGGHDINGDHVKTACFLCLCGESMRAGLAKVGVEVAKKSALAQLNRLPGKILIEINKKVGFRLFTKAGQKGVINFTKAIPFVGGFAGCAINVWWTRTVGNLAIKEFCN